MADSGLTMQDMPYDQHLALSRFAFDGTSHLGFAIGSATSSLFVFRNRGRCWTWKAAPSLIRV